MQAGFTFPLLACTQPILSQLGLIDEKAPAGKPVYFQVYDRIHEEWEQVQMGYSIKLRKDDHPFFAAADIDCDSLPEFDLKCARYHTSGDTMHVRNNLAGERRSVREQANERIIRTASELKTLAKGKAKPLRSPVQPRPKPKPLPRTAHAPKDIFSDSVDDSSSELEPLVFPWDSRKRTITNVDRSGSDAAIKKPASSPLYISSASPEPRPARSVRRKLHAEEDSDAISIPSRSSPEPAASRRWPQDFYLCDIDACFAECKKKKSESQAPRDDGSGNEADSDFDKSADEAEERSESVKEIFARIFGQDTSFVRSTFYDVRKRYATMRTRNRDLVQIALSAGRKNTGLWKNFVLTLPKHTTKKRTLANARRTMNKHNGNSS